MTINPSSNIRELRLTRIRLLVTLNQAKGKFAPGAGEVEAQTVYGAVEGLRLSIQKEQQRLRAAA